MYKSVDLMAIPTIIILVGIKYWLNINILQMVWG